MAAMMQHYTSDPCRGLWEIQPPEEPISEAEKRFFHIFRKLDIEDKETIEAMIKIFLKRKKASD